jgi:hypothetical protein
MKKLLALVLILISMGVNAQYSKNYKQNKVSNFITTNSEFVVAHSVLVSGFLINESIMHNPELTLEQKSDMTLKVYGGTVISTVASYYFVKWLKKKPFKKKYKRKY